ncbi:dihydrodipicolinate synthase family protein [Nonomuraea sp. NPDC050404]|uniref:dihydrodipicolinate synthase family protein n=1 Tax=Nonomuraea sp. NPDC050404 TaxID=3155783 RepID=UPI0033EFA568
MPAVLAPSAARTLLEGVIIPAHPLVITPDGTLDERRQRALTRYYLDAGAGGLALGVHTTQFGIRAAGLLEPVLRLAAEEAAANAGRMRAASAGRMRAASADRARVDVGRVPAADEDAANRPAVRGSVPVLVAGVAGGTAEAVREAGLAASLGYDLAMPILRGLDHLSDPELITHLAEIGEVLPLCGFYLQPAVGGRILGVDFWREAAKLPALRAVKIAPFDRYRTIDVVRAVCESGRADEIALYTGNDDNILIDLLTEFSVPVEGRPVTKRIVGGLLGQTAVWTHRAVDLLRRAHEAAGSGRVDAGLLTLAARLTDANAAVFDVAHGFAGCIAGVHEVLRRQGLLTEVRLLDPAEGLSPGQAEELDRVIAAYPELVDDEFVARHRDAWLGTA